MVTKHIKVANGRPLARARLAQSEMQARADAKLKVGVASSKLMPEDDTEL